MNWEEILNDKSFQAQSAAVKARVAANFFRENIASDPVFAEQPEATKAKVRYNFFATLQEKPQVEGVMEGFVKPTLKAAPRVAGATIGSLVMTPLAGLQGLYDTATKGAEAGAKSFEQVASLPQELLQTRGQQAGFENIGLAMKPFQMAGEGWREIVGLTPLKGTVAEPIAGTIGEAASMFGLPLSGRAAGARVRNLETNLKVMAPDAAPSAPVRPFPMGTDQPKSPYSPELAASVRTASQPALPPGQGFVLQERRPSSAFSPELAADVKRASQPTLPPGQGFALLEVDRYFDQLREQVGTMKISKAERKAYEVKIEQARKQALERAREEQVNEAYETTAEAPKAPPAQEIQPVEATITERTVEAPRPPEIVEPGATSGVREPSFAFNPMEELPVNRALSEIKSQGGLNIESLRERYSQPQMTELVKKRPGLVSKNGKATLDEMADMHGYESGDVLLQDILGAKSKKAYAEAEKADIEARYYDEMKDRIAVGDLKPGDKFVRDGEEFTHTGYNTEGNAIIKDGETIIADPFEVLRVDKVKKAKFSEATQDIPGFSERETFSLTESPGMVGDRVKPKGSDTETMFNVGVDVSRIPEAARKIAETVFRNRGPVKPLGKEPTTPAERVKAMYDRTDAEIAKREALTLDGLKDSLNRSILDVSAKAKEMLVNTGNPLAKEAVMRRDLIAGSNSEAMRQFGGYEKQIYKGLSSNEEAILDRVINSRRTVQIGEYKDIKHSGGMKPEDHANYLKDIELIEDISKEQADNIRARSDAYFKAMDDQLKQRLDAGLISRDQFDELSKYIYSPRRFFEHMDAIDSQISGRPITVGSSGIKGLQEGSEGLMETRTRDLLASQVARTQDLIFRNRANQSLVNLAEAVPDNGVVRLAKRIGTKGTGEPIYATAPNGYEKLSAMVDGEQVPFIVPKEFADAWVKSDPLIQANFANMLSWLSGSKILKAGATGYNPAFVITNMPRDIALIWSGEQYSAHLPVAAAQMVRDLATVAPDVFLRKGRVADYIKQGGGMEFLSHYGRFRGAGEVGQKLKMAEKALGWIGETSEIWTRIAHRERALKNGMSPEEATYTARTGSIDFSQGGSAVKAADTVIPYLNAAIQGTRTLARNAMKNPGVFAYKMAQLGTASAMLYAWNMQNPEAWSQISDRDKEANFIFIVPDVLPGATSYTDDQGAKRYRYIKIAKDQGQRVFTTAVESLLQYAYEGKVPKKQVFAALSDLGVPYKIPALSALIALGNYDDFTYDKVWKGPEGIAPEQEYTKDTPAAFVNAGAVTGMSPERMRAAVGKIIPPNNPFTAAVGTGIKTASGETSEELARKGWNQFVSESPSLRRAIAITSPSHGYREELAEEKEASRTETFKQNRELDNLTNRFFQTGRQEDGQKILAYIQGQPEQAQDRLVKRYEAAYEIKDLPDRGFWKQMRGLAPEARAKILYRKVVAAPQAEKVRLVETANRISGILSDRMMDEWERLSKQ